MILTTLTIDWEVSPRIITVAAPVTEVTMQNLYDTCRWLESQPGAMDQDPIVSAGGGESLGGGVSVGLTVTLLNALLAFEARSGPEYVQCNASGGNVVALQADLITYYTTPIKPTAFTQVVVTASSSATASDIEAIQFASFNGAVTIDVDSIYDGTDFPVGTPQAPVNNMDDALLIATERGFKKLDILSDLVIEDASINEFIIEGRSHVDVNVTILPEALVEKVTIKSAIVAGTLDGDTEIDSCTILDIDYVNGHIHNCDLGGTISLGGNKDALIKECTMIDINSIPTVDMGNAGQDLILANFTGLLNIINLTGNNKIGVGLTAGQIMLDSSSVVSGEIRVSGIGTLTDENDVPILTGIWNGGVNVTNELMNKNTIAEAVWDEDIGEHLIAGSTGLSIGNQQFAGAVHINVAGVSGTVFPTGTESNPVNNITDAKIIAGNNGIGTIKFYSDYIFVAGDNISGYILTSATHNELTLESGTINYYTNFKDVAVKGSLFGYSILQECSISPEGITGLYGVVQGLTFSGPIQISGTNTHNVVLIDCKSVYTGEPPIIDCNGDGAKITIRGFIGGIQFSNKTGDTQKISIDMISGRIGFNNTVTAGTIDLRGVGHIYKDEAGDSVIFDTQGFISQPTIAEAVWDEDIGEHLIAGSTGLSIGISQFTGAVHIDTIRGTTGTTFPLGTHATPVDNLADAVSIAELRGLSVMEFGSDFTFDSTVNISNYVLTGFGYQSTVLTFETGCILLNCRLEKITATGTIIGARGYTDCMISNLNNASPVASDLVVNVKNCLLQGVTQMSSLFTGKLYLIDCWGVPLDGEVPTLDMNYSNFDVEFRNYSGFIKLTDCTDTHPDVRIMLNSGGVILDSTVTGGHFIFTGTGTLEDNSTSVTSLNVEALMSQDIVANAVWNESIANHLIEGTTGKSIGNQQFAGLVHIDPIGGMPGTIFPIGTHSYPVNNIADAKIIATREGIDGLGFNNDYIIPTGTDISYYVLSSHNASMVTLDTGVTTNGTIFHDLYIQDEFNGYVTINEATIGPAGITKYYGVARGCIYDGPVQVSSDSTHYSVFLNSFSGAIPGAQVFDCNGDGAKILMRGLTGVFEFHNKTGSSQKLFIDLYSARVGFHSSMTAGACTLRGIGFIYLDDSTNFAINTDGFISKENISHAVWDEPISDHLEAGTTGKTLSDSGSSGNPWATDVAGNKDPGTFGELVGDDLAKKKDVFNASQI